MSTTKRPRRRLRSSADLIGAVDTQDLKAAGEVRIALEGPPILGGGAGLHRGGELSRSSQEIRAILRAVCEGGEGACASFTLPPPPEVDEGRVRGTLRRLKALVWSEGDE